MRSFTLLAVAALAAAIPTTARAQVEGRPPEVGAVAPDFSLPGATRFGTLRDPVRLGDFRGRTVVLSFIPRARART
jgi:peroxiredoxin